MDHSSTENAKAADTPSVFFSYSREDRAHALPIIEALQSAGFNIWYDGMLEPGVKYLEKTEHVLMNARAVIVLWSPRSVQSNWVRDEAMIGRERENLIPLSIEQALPPLGFRQFQATDFSTWANNSDASEMQALMRQLALLHEQPAPEPMTPPPPNPPQVNRRLALGFGAGALLIGGGFLTRSLLNTASPNVRKTNGVVVLSFANLSGTPENDYIPAGLSTELRGALMRNAALRVVAQQTSDAVKNRGLDAVEIASELGVSFILDGSLSIVGDALRLSLELIDGTDGFRRWSDVYVAEPDQLLLLQETIITEILRSITDDLETAEAPLIGAASNPAAYDQYLRGLDSWQRVAIPEDARVSLDYFDAAVRFDPEFAAAHARRGLILSWLSNSSRENSEIESLSEKALTAARLAIEHGPDLDEAHSTLGWVEFFTAANFAAAAAPFERSIELGQGNAAVLARYATYAALVRKHSTARTAIARAVRLDPLNPYMHGSQATISYYAGDYEHAMQSARSALNISEQLGTVWSRLGLAQILANQPELALQSCEREPNLDLRYTCKAIAHARLDDRDSARLWLDKLISEFGDDWAVKQAMILTQLGELDSAMEALNIAYARANAGLVAIYADPMLAPLRARSDYSRLLSQVGFDSV